jgi:preprotein translocase subunit SecG
MSELFFRTLSQGLQAFVPVAAAIVWARCTGRVKPVAALRWGLAAGIVFTPVAGYLFKQSTLQARWEASLAAIAGGLALYFYRAVRRSSANDGGTPAPIGTVRLVALAAATVVIVNRQTMEIAVVFGAVLEMRSRDAFLAILGGVAASLVLAWIYVQANRRASAALCTRVTAAFAGVFFLQCLVYAFHEAAETGFMPFSELLHTASEPYGPDGVYGQYLTYLLLIVPMVAAASAVTNSRTEAPGARLGGWLLTRPIQAIGVVALALVAGVIVLRAQNGGAGAPSFGHAAPAAASVTSTASARIHLPATMAGSRLLYRHTAGDATSSSLAIAALEAPAANLLSVPFVCDRVSFAAGNGICLQTERGLFTSYKAVLFDERMQARHSIKLEGTPSRTRVSADGRLGAVTVFVTGQAHGYSSDSFSTRTSLIDMASGEEITDLEQFTTWRNGVKVHAADFNFWGVTFAKDSNTFYATLKTDGKTYLVQGDLGLRKLTILHENLECPSLSPNNRLIAFKKRTGPDLAPWRIYVLDLTTMVEHAIEAETRSVDDQLEWLDDERVLYGMRRSSQSALSDVWVAAVDGSTPARVFVPEADSPIVVRATHDSRP